jgi:hypothetical protein
MPERHQSIDAQLRLLAPGKVSEDDKLVEYDALLVDRFLDILQDLHGPHLREFVRPNQYRLPRFLLTPRSACFDEAVHVLIRWLLFACAGAGVLRALGGVRERPG